MMYNVTMELKVARLSEQTFRLEIKTLATKSEFEI